MKKLIFTLIIVAMVFVVGCGSENGAVYNSAVDKPYQAQQGEIFVGHYDYYDKDCYLLKNSIRQNKDKSVVCKIKMVKSATDIEYLEYTFYGKNNMDFTTDTGFHSTANERITPIEYNIYETLTQYVDMNQVDDTLHITPEEFQRKYNSFVKYGENLKIKRIEIDPNVDKNAMCFRLNNNWGIIAFKNEKSGYITDLMLMREQLTKDIPAILAASIYAVSGKKDFEESLNLHSDLMGKVQNSLERVGKI